MAPIGRHCHYYTGYVQYHISSSVQQLLLLFVFGSMVTSFCCTSGTDNIFKCFYIKETTFHHPLIIVYFSNIAAAMIMKYANHQIIFF